MLNLQHKQEQPTQITALVNELIQERQQVWSLYCQVAEQKPFASNRELPTMINEFCQILIDYISLAHFGIYQSIADNSESSSDVIKTAESEYSKIVDSTAAAVNFNDKYVQTCIKVSLANLEKDLSVLGEQLALRIDSEDKICEMMLH